MNERLELFSALVELRNSELTALWARFNCHLLVNAGYLVAFVSCATDTLLKKLGWMPYISGIFLAGIWILSELKRRRTLNMRDDKIKNLEQIFWTQEPLSDFQVFRNRPKELKVQARISMVLIIGFISAWILLLLLHSFDLIHQCKIQT